METVHGLRGQDLYDFCAMVQSGSMVEAIADEFEIPSTDVKFITQEVKKRAGKYGSMEAYMSALTPSETTETTPTSKTVRTSEGLRDALFETMDKLRSGELSASDAIAVCKVSEAICKTVALEMAAEKAGAGNDNQQQPKTLTLGTNRDA